jgi:hypothetical protein
MRCPALLPFPACSLSLHVYSPLVEVPVPLPFPIFLGHPRQALSCRLPVVAAGIDFVVATDESHYSTVGRRRRCGDVYRGEGIET